MQNISGPQSNVAQQQSLTSKPITLGRMLNIYLLVSALVCIAILFFAFWIYTHRNPKAAGLDLPTTILTSIVLPMIALLFSAIGTYLQVRPSLHALHHQSPTPVLVQSSSQNLMETLNANAVPLLTAAKVVLQHREVVRNICRTLRRPDVTAIALVGLMGIGKSTLASLVYQYRYAVKGPFAFMSRLFIAQPLRLTISENVTFAYVAQRIFAYTGKSMPQDFNTMSADGKALTLTSAMEHTNKTQLVILDQFDNWLEWRTGYALQKYPEVDAWLHALNNQKCDCQMILTSRILPQPRPRGISSNSSGYMQEHYVQALKIAQGVELLRMRVQNADVKDAELQAAVNHCGGHAGALATLASLLKDEPSLNLGSSRCTTRWRKSLAKKILDNSYLLHLTQEERDLLTYFCVYRTPISMEVALNTQPYLIAETYWSALDALLKCHLFQRASKNTYLLHPVIAWCVQEYLFGDDKNMLQTLHESAARYYESLGWPSRGVIRQREDIRPLIEMIWHMTYAERWADAYNMMQKEQIVTLLHSMGDEITLLELYQQLLPLKQWHPTLEQQQSINNTLCSIYQSLQREEEAQQYRQEVLRIAQEMQRNSAGSIPPAA